VQIWKWPQKELNALTEFSQPHQQISQCWRIIVMIILWSNRKDNWKRAQTKLQIHSLSPVLLKPLEPERPWVARHLHNGFPAFPLLAANSASWLWLQAQSQLEPSENKAVGGWVGNVSFLLFLHTKSRLPDFCSLAEVPRMLVKVCLECQRLR
jgi:hypothetical protein